MGARITPSGGTGIAGSFGAPPPPPKGKVEAGGPTPPTENSTPPAAASNTTDTHAASHAAPAADAIAGANGTGGATGGGPSAVEGAANLDALKGILASLGELLKKLTELIQSMTAGANGGGPVQQSASQCDMDMGGSTGKALAATSGGGPASTQASAPAASATGTGAAAAPAAAAMTSAGGATTTGVRQPVNLDSMHSLIQGGGFPSSTSKQVIDPITNKPTTVPDLDVNALFSTLSAPPQGSGILAR